MKQIPIRRNGIYYLPGNRQYWSITTILDVINKPKLQRWYAYQGAKVALQTPTLKSQECVGEVYRNLRKTQDRGTFIHKACQDIAEGRKIEIKGKYASFLHGVESYYKTIKPVHLQSEVLVYSDRYQYAGRMDEICKIGNYNSLIDYKSGKDIYAQVGLQLAAGAQALHEMQIIDIDKMYCVLFMETGEYIMKEIKESFDNFLKAYELFKWWKKKEV